MARIVEAVLVENQRVGLGAEFEQPVPVAGTPREPGDLETEHEAGIAHGHFADQCPEAIAVPVGAGLAEIGIDHDDLLDGPAERMCPRAQRVLAMDALGVLRHLAITTTATLVLLVVLSSVGVHAQSLDSLIERLDRLEDEKNGSFARR